MPVVTMPRTQARPATSPEPPVRPDPHPVTERRAEDRTLVGRAAGGDAEAFATIMRRTRDMLRATALGILGGSSDADDVVQETFIAAWDHLDGLQDGAAIAGWLRTTVRRRSYDRLRTVSVRRQAELGDHLPAAPERAPAAVAERLSLVAAAQRVLDGMPPVQRRCWELRHLERRSYDDIAAALGLPVSTVRGQLARARVVVERELAPWR